MPSGIYPRTRNQLKAAVANLAKGREKPARKKATQKLREIAQNPEWRKKVGKVTKEAMWRPEIRKKHLAGLQRAREKYGINFKGGNGQEPVEEVKKIALILEPQGYIREFLILTNGHNIPGFPNSYKVDFGNPETKVAVEVDGPSHYNLAQQKLDRKKERILKNLGWTVLRIKH